MKETVQHALEDLHFTPERQHRFLRQMHFAVTSVAETGYWLQGLLAEWASPRKVITVIMQQGRLNVLSHNPITPVLADLGHL